MPKNLAYKKNKELASIKKILKKTKKNRIKLLNNKNSVKTLQTYKVDGFRRLLKNQKLFKNKHKEKNRLILCPQ